MKKFFVLILSFFVGACAMPERTITTSASWPVDGKIATVTQSDREMGIQLLWGERTSAQSTPVSHLIRTSDNRAAGTVVGAVAGGAFGLAAGQPAIGAVVGTAAGAVSDALNKQATVVTTETLVNPFAK